MSQLHLPHWNFHLPAMHWPAWPGASRGTRRMQRQGHGAHWRMAVATFFMVVLVAVVSAAYLLMTRTHPAVVLEMPLAIASAAPSVETDEFQGAKQAAAEEELPPQF